MRSRALRLVACLVVGTVGALALPGPGSIPGPAGAFLEVTTSPDAETAHGGVSPPADGGSPNANGSPNAAASPAPALPPIGGSPTAPAARGLLGEGPLAPDPASLTGYRWPLARGSITNPFGPSWYGALLIDGKRFHDGLDIASRCGDRVVAAHAGLVLAAGRHFDEWAGWAGSIAPHEKRMAAGNLWLELPITVVIDDGNGYRSIYAHFSAVTVRPGQRVRAGQQIGWEGMTGKATGCHVHYGLFSPFETARMTLRPDVQKRTRYPALEIARINPLLVLPKLPKGRTSGIFPLPGQPPQATPAVEPEAPG